MKRTYLEEDLALIRRYFPGAKTVNLRTPFDLTQRYYEPRLHATSFRESNEAAGSLAKEAVWTN